MRNIPQSLWLEYIAIIGEAMSDPSVSHIDSLREKAEKLVMYSPGRSQLQRDIHAAEKAENWEVFGCLSSVVKTKADSALMLRELYSKALEECKEPDLPPKPVGFTHRWHPQEPIWPNNDTMREAVQHMIAFRQGFEELSRMAFRAMFQREWVREFTGLDGLPVKLTEDRQGWSMRDAVIERTKKSVKSAATLSPLDVTKTCCVFDGQEIFYVSQVVENPFEPELLNVTVAHRDSVRTAHRDEIWVCFPYYSG